MKAQYENQIMSSLLLFVDHQVLKYGEAYFPVNRGRFYPIKTTHGTYYSYSSPFKQFVSDESISGAKVVTKVYVNGAETSIGSNSLIGINHYQGQVYFSENKDSSVITADYYAKDFNIYIAKDSEQKLLFNTKKSLNPLQQTIGLDPDSEPCPAIFIKNMGGSPSDFALGGLQNHPLHARLIVLSDSVFKLDAVCGIFKNTKLKTVPIIGKTPFNSLGTYLGQGFNYSGLATGEGPLIWSVRVSKPSTMGELEKLGLFPAFIDLDLQTIKSIS